jgi:hypothetical protein
MAARTIASPGVQINEVDLSLIARPVGETNVFLTGFSDQGPTDEIINVTSLTEYEQIFGVPTNAAERYTYHSAKQLLTTSPANLLFTRMPYGSGMGDGFTNTYSALVYGISANANTYETATQYQILEPESILLTENEYLDLIENNVAWNNGYINQRIQDFTQIGRAGLVVLNSSKSTVNNLFEGYYIALADNSNSNPSTEFNTVTGVLGTRIKGIHENGKTKPGITVEYEELLPEVSISTLPKEDISRIINTYKKIKVKNILNQSKLENLISSLQCIIDQ